MRVQDALSQARRLLADGADVIDVGGASSRPRGKLYGAGAEFVSAAEEQRRVLPVVEALSGQGVTVSIDTDVRWSGVSREKERCCFRF